MRLLVLLMMIPCIAVANEVRVPLFAQILGDADKTPLASLVYDKESTSFSIVDVNDALPADSYCIGAEMDSNYYSCFSYIQLRYPLHYDLFIDTRQDSHLLYKLSLKPNPNAQGINPVLRTPSAGPQPLLTQLKKTTKTYEDKKPKLGHASASFEEDAEPDERSFLQKNWKYMLLGLIIYNFLGKSAASAQQ